MQHIPNFIKVRLRQAEGLYPKIISLCEKHIETPNDLHLEEISSYFGTMTTILRSALNYTMWDFVENKLKNVLLPDEYKHLQWFHDFPLARDKAEFDRETNDKKKKKLLYFIHKHGLTDVYQFLEKTQPYHDKNYTLQHLRWISNDTSHTFTVESALVNIRSFSMGPSIPKPFVSGDKLVVPSFNGPSEIYPLPCFVKPYYLFVSSSGQWSMFSVNTPEKNKKLGLIKFSEDLNEKVNQIISDFYSLQ
jgi:hypothetical protein